MEPMINSEGLPMQPAKSTRHNTRHFNEQRASQRAGQQMHPISAIHVEAGSPQRAEAERFVRKVFHHRYGARVSVFAPRLLMLEQAGHPVAVAGWRGAAAEPLFLENYLDAPIETILHELTGQSLRREQIVEVGNLASEKAGGSLQVILHMARQFIDAGYEWVVFTATKELIGIFAKLGLPLLALAKADPARLGAAAADWGSYYASSPVVVAGRIRLALDRFGSGV